MLIPFKNCLEGGMETTFNDLKEKHLKLIETQWRLRERLQDKTDDLLREYAESLSLPATSWTDSQGKGILMLKQGCGPRLANLRQRLSLVCRWTPITA